MKIRTFITFTGFALLLSANAEAAHSKFACTYQVETGANQILTFEAPEVSDISSPHRKEIELYVNGQSEPLQFNVKTVFLHVGQEIVFTYQNKFYLSDITIKIVEHQIDGITSFNGTWKTDSPQIIQLNCTFLN